MKFVATALTSLLLLGVCSARSHKMFEEIHSSDVETSRPREMDNMKQREADYSKDAQGYRPEGEPNRAEEQNSQRWQLREAVYRKLGNWNQQLTSSRHTFQIDSLADLADPIYVGKVEGQYAMLGIHYENVLFQGMRSADQAVVSVDTDSKEATLTLSLKTAEIRGNYEAADSTKKVAGSFNVQMFGDLSYECTYRYQLQEGNKVQLLHAGGKLNYNRPVSQYENANFPDFIQNPLQAALLRTIDEKLHAELNYKLGNRVVQSIQAAHQGHPQDPIENVMGERIKKAISGIQQVLSKRGVSSIELTSDDKEMVYNKLHAKIASVRLNGLEKFYLANTQVSNENADRIRAKLQFAINKPTATAVVNIHESHEENAPFQKIDVDFDMEQLMAELSLEKASRQSGLELRSVQTKVERIRPMGTDKFQGEVGNLIKDKLTGHMKRYVEEGLKTFIQTEYLYIISRGVLPPSQEKESARSQM